MGSDEDTEARKSARPPEVTQPVSSRARILIPGHVDSWRPSSSHSLVVPALASEQHNQKRLSHIHTRLLSPVPAPAGGDPERKGERKAWGDGVRSPAQPQRGSQVLRKPPPLSGDSNREGGEKKLLSETRHALTKPD